MPSPRRPQVFWNHLGRQLKMWKSYRIVDAHALKLLKLWLGYDFLDLMDEFGRIPVPYFNEVRRRLGYKTFALLLDDIRRSQSFYIVGNSETDITAFFSPLWHNYEAADGVLLRGSMRVEESQNESQNGGYSKEISKEINNKENPTGGNATAISDVTNPTDENQNLKREVFVRRRIVKDYFTWLLRQQDSEHRSMVDDLMFRICNPRRKSGEHIPELALTEAQGKEVFQIMVDKYLVPYFQTREEFFKPTFIQHPEKRVKKTNCDYTKMNVLKVRDQKLCHPGEVFYKRQDCGRYDECASETEAITGTVINQDVMPWAIS